MGSRHKPKAWEFETNPYDDYDDDMIDELDDDLDDISNISKDFYSTDWEDPSDPDGRFSTRRKIERRNDLKELYSQFDDWDDFDVSNVW